jgi:lipoprotein-anchoring transpeptidase ErfK/SrfK
VVDPDSKFLYLVRENDRAIRYGVGVGKAGLAWSGEARIKRKVELTASYGCFGAHVRGVSSA